jgi:predicted aspartyl protease
MKNTAYAGLAIKVALFYLIAAGVCQSIQAQSEVRFRLVHDTLIVVSLMANGEGPFDFVLDTGADTSVVDPSIAPRLSLVPLDGLRQTTLAGVQTLPRGSMRILTVGPVQVRNLEVLVQDLAELRKLDSHIEGIVGQDLLSHFNYLLDYRSHIVHIEQGSEIQDSIEGDRVSLEVAHNRMLVASEAQSRNHATLHLLLDSGANSVVLLRTASQALNLQTQAPAPGLEMTSSGQVGLRVARVHELSVASQQFRDVAVALPAADPAEQIGDGLLPTVFFHALYVNNHNGFVVFNPRVKKNWGNKFAIFQ